MYDSSLRSGNVDASGSIEMGGHETALFGSHQLLGSLGVDFQYDEHEGAERNHQQNTGRQNQGH